MRDTRSPSGGGATHRLEMVDVGPKVATRRRAVARGRIWMSRESFEATRRGTNPKGDVLVVAEVAGILGAKRTAEVIPPLGLEQAIVRFELDAATMSVLVSCEATTTAKTGAEIEALCGVTTALLAIYDLAKAIDPALAITDVHVSSKEGGKSGHWSNPLRPGGGEDAP